MLSEQPSSASIHCQSSPWKSFSGEVGAHIIDSSRRVGVSDI